MGMIQEIVDEIRHNEEARTRKELALGIYNKTVQVRYDPIRNEYILIDKNHDEIIVQPKTYKEIINCLDEMK